MASVTCANCQTVAAPGATTCPSCGTSLAGSATTPSSGSSTPQIKFDAASLSQTDRIIGGATVVLFISLFLPWFSVSFGSIGSVSADGLTSHGYEYITLIVSLAVIGLLALGALGLWKLPASSPVGRDQLLLIGTGISFVLVLLGFLFKPGGSGVGWSFGAFVALVAAVVAVLPLGRPALAARRGK